MNIEDDINIGGSRASQIMAAILAKQKANNLKVGFQDNRPKTVSKNIVDKVMNKDNKTKFKKTIDLKSIKYINSLYPNILNKDWKDIYKIMLKNINEYNNQRKKTKKQDIYVKINDDAVNEVKNMLSSKVSENLKDDTQKKGQLNKEKKINVANDILNKSVDKIIKKKIKDMTPDEKREYNRLAKRRQYERQKQTKPKQKLEPEPKPKPKQKPKQKLEPEPEPEPEPEIEPDSDYETSEEAPITKKNIKPNKNNNYGLKMVKIDKSFKKGKEINV
jgi:hypothetical protein